ncbi:MAG: response regulator transcription factor [Alloprevotella sp.]|nr:response regulator transcription factor [Alloprevotella sp.]
MEKIKLLLVEDESDLVLILKDTLTQEGFSVRTAHNGVDGLRLFHEETPQVIVADVMMPQMDGFEMIRRIRLEDSQTPVLFLTARTAVDDVVRGFELGANDFLRKPFGVRELIVRVRALAGRKQTSINVSADNYRIGSYQFYPTTQELRHLPTGHTALLSFRECAILRHLCSHRREIVNMQTLLLDVWGDDSFYNQKSLHVFITKLRHKLSKDPSVRIINARGLGYKLLDEHDTQDSFGKES